MQASNSSSGCFSDTKPVPIRTDPVLSNTASGRVRPELVPSEKDENVREFLRFGNNFYICRPIQGLRAEWLGRGLQNLLQRFNSASGLDEKGLSRITRQPLFHGARLSRITPEPRESSVSPSAGNILRFIPRGDPRSGYFSSGLCRTTHSAATFPRRRRRSSQPARNSASAVPVATSQ